MISKEYVIIERAVSFPADMDMSQAFNIIHWGILLNDLKTNPEYSHTSSNKSTSKRCSSSRQAQKLTR